MIRIEKTLNLVTFTAEARAAGLLRGDLPWSRDEGGVTIEQASQADEAAIRAVVAAHDPDAPVPIDLAAYAKQARDRLEFGGITFNGVAIATDDRSKTLIAGVRMRAEDDPNLVEAWAAADGETYALPAAVLIAISRAVGAHVSACFKAYANALAAIRDGVMTTTAQVDAAFALVGTAYPKAG